jgi:hypothetical protein
MNQVAQVMPPEPAAPTKALNPYEGERSTKVVGTSAAAEVNRAVAEVQASIMLAKQFPRNKMEAVDRILADCGRLSLAEAAMYSYTKGGTEVSGPSIRLAEAIAQNWGNLHFGWDELSRVNGQSEILAWAWDFETNVKRTTKFYVKHFRNTKKGGYVITDEREIYEMCANQAARRMRACILNIIPGDVVEAAETQCEQTMVDSQTVSPDSIAKMVKAFEAFKVTKAQIEKFIQRNVEGMNGATMNRLRKIYNGLKEGMSKAEEFFEPEMAETETTNATAETKKAAEPEISDWDAMVDEMLLGVNGAKDTKELDAFLNEALNTVEALSKSNDTKAIKKWREGVSKRFAALAPVANAEAKKTDKLI